MQASYALAGGCVSLLMTGADHRPEYAGRLRRSAEPGLSVAQHPDYASEARLARCLSTV